MKPSQKSAPVLTASHNSGEGDSSVTTNCTGADTPSSVSTSAQDKFKRTYAVEIEFDTPFDFAEQDRLACVVLEKLVDGYWSDAAAGTQQGNMPIKVIAYPIPDQGR